MSKRPPTYRLESEVNAKPTESLNSGSNDFEAETVALAKKGNSEALSEILGTFSTAVDSKSQHTWQGSCPYVYARFIADALKQIMLGADVAAAFGMVSKVGRPRASGATHNLDALAAAYAVLLLNGLLPKQAKLHLHEQTGATVRTIEKAFAVESAESIRFCLKVARGIEINSELDPSTAAEMLKVVAQPYDAALQSILLG